ncbi:hypothetical protein OG552_14545 [Streptomyces sp. NBC_01476]|uniref:hypothetical protein n=1 Tax=Streptomyces sp. NBC_01476 TaxID=2903881 RepID=UPI002E35E973|nr:hypothetical protein [Streptomyces sp. NBC_01476]
MTTHWPAEPGETALHRVRISYATGAAVPVSGSRWFRDTERNDIQHELPGWPQGPEYTVHTPGQQGTRRAGRFLRTGVPALIGAALEALAGTPSGIDAKTLGQPAEPANEVDDFPVMWAAPGTIARTMPWQLDPARRAKDHTTHLVITDRRIVLLQEGPGKESAPEELLVLTRDLIDRAERMRFSRDERDVRIWFRDGSWVRVDLSDVGAGLRLHLSEAPVLLAPDALPPAQRKAFDTWLARWPGCDEPPSLVRLPSGNVLVQQRVPEPGARDGHRTQSVVIGTDGANGFDPDDY